MLYFQMQQIEPNWLSSGIFKIVFEWLCYIVFHNLRGVEVIKFYQIKRILKLWRMVIFIRHKNGDFNVRMERRLAEIVSPNSQVKSPTVAVPIDWHQLEVDGSTWSDLAADGVDGEVAAVVATDDPIADL